MPLALSPDLAYRLWANFQRDTSGALLGIPWVAVADLLLSPLCDEVGDDLYEMDEALRSVLLERLATDPRFGPNRLHRVAAFLDAYVEQQLNSDDVDARDFAQAQHWAALAYTAPRAAASELARAFAAVPLVDKPEVVRIASVVEALATPLESFPTLLTYAQAAQSVARGRDHPAVRELQSLAGPEDRVEVAGISVPVPSQQRRWDVALSFADAQRDYVGQVAHALKARGVRCFYDAGEQVQLRGTHLAEELPQIYARESAAVVVFISADYAGGDWMRVNRRAAFSRAMADAGVHVLPARFDDSELPGLLPDVVAVDLRRYTPEQFADLVIAKLADLHIISLSPAPGRAGRGPAGGVQVPEAPGKVRATTARRVARLVLLGPPGAGKGTQAQFISSHLSIPKISTGDIFKDNVSHGTALGRRARAYMERGDLVPDEITLAMVADRLADDDAAAGFLLDGFPRNVPQAETLKKMLLAWGTRLDMALELVVDEDEVMRRLSGRRTCRRCGRVWHTTLDPPARPGICDDCGGELFQRDDDREETIRHRLEVYQQQTAPLIAFYADEQILLGIDATGPVDEITERALSAMRRFSR